MIGNLILGCILNTGWFTNPIEYPISMINLFLLYGTIALYISPDSSCESRTLSPLLLSVNMHSFKLLRAGIGVLTLAVTLRQLHDGYFNEVQCVILAVTVSYVTEDDFKIFSVMVMA